MIIFLPLTFSLEPVLPLHRRKDPPKNEGEDRVFKIIACQYCEMKSKTRKFSIVVDGYKRYKEDVKLINDFGANSYQFFIS